MPAREDCCLSDPHRSAPIIFLKSSVTFGTVHKVLYKQGECGYWITDLSQMDLLHCASFLQTLDLILHLAYFSPHRILLSTLSFFVWFRALSSAASLPLKSRSLPEIESFVRAAFACPCWASDHVVSLWYNNRDHVTSGSSEKMHRF